jgi:hypothetical protein
MYTKRATMQSSEADRILRSTLMQTYKKILMTHDGSEMSDKVMETIGAHHSQLWQPLTLL